MFVDIGIPVAVSLWFAFELQHHSSSFVSKYVHSSLALFPFPEKNRKYLETVEGLISCISILVE